MGQHSSYRLVDLLWKAQRGKAGVTALAEEVVHVLRYAPSLVRNTFSNPLDPEPYL